MTKVGPTWINSSQKLGQSRAALGGGLEGDLGSVA